MKRTGLLLVFLLCLFVTTGVPAQQAKTGIIHGKFVEKDGISMAGGIVIYFNLVPGPKPSKTDYYKIPDYVDKIDSEGSFSTELPEGRYWFGAIKRIEGPDRIGPPQKGEIFYASIDEEGKPKWYPVKAGEKTDTGVVSEIYPYDPAIVELKEGDSAIEGLILDQEGNPIEGALVFAYMDVANLLGKPMYVSDRTGQDGKYILRVYEGGEYYLRVRNIYGGGPPVAGQILGGYGHKEPVAVVVKTGEITSGIDMNVIKFPGRGPKAGRIGSSNIQPQMQDKTDGSNEEMDK